MGRAEHHADGVNEIILALVGGIVWKSNGNFRVREYDGAPANMLWLETEKDVYCFKYNHEEACISSVGNHVLDRLVVGEELVELAELIAASCA